jgi:adenosine deaminase
MVVTVNTDDPAIFRIDLIDEYMLLFENGIFTGDEIFDIIRSGVSASFLPHGKKQTLLDTINKHIDEIKTV